MEVKASKFATEDIISNMPDNVVTHILDRLPVKEAVKTSILSKNWSLKWTMLSQLVFDDDFFDNLCKTNKIERIVSRLLLNLKGAITKFVLYIVDFEVDDEDIAHWILFLSRKGLKELTILNMLWEPLKLPIHLFSCLELKHLKLLNCSFHPPTTFHGFPKLVSLELGHCESNKFGQFITQCPLLEVWNMHYWHYLHNDEDMPVKSVGKVKLVEIANLANLKRLSLSLCDTVMITNSSSIIEHLGYLPKLQELNLDFSGCKFTKDDAKNRFPATFPCLKTLNLSTTDVNDGVLLSCAVELVRSCPNLRTLRITANDLDYDPAHAKCSPDVDYNTTVQLLQLQFVEVLYFKDTVTEVCLIQYLLASCPFLKRFVVWTHWKLSRDATLMFAKKLLELHRPFNTKIELH